MRCAAHGCATTPGMILAGVPSCRHHRAPMRQVVRRLLLWWPGRAVPEWDPAVRLASEVVHLEGLPEGTAQDVVRCRRIHLELAVSP